MIRAIGVVMILGLLLSGSLLAQDANRILSRVDSVINAPKDQKATMKMILVDKQGNQKIRQAEFMQKGSEKRLLRFTAPADQKGIAFLSLPNDVQYLYMPAFHKVRRIASHVKNTKFAGTDFTYDDLSAFSYSRDFNARLLETNDQFWVLELTPKPGVEKDYGKLKMWVRRDNYYPVKVEFYDPAGNLWKIMERRQITRVGNYWVAREMEMQDLKEQHRTIIQLDDISFDLNLPDKYFTRRYLKRGK
ncbi:MAG: outer membrane lipoprotein-sorting protein [Calditrichaeota bacterium]|nr:outer membrane lipoprotein-sorting protein [Calditrichota bacterium]